MTSAMYDIRKATGCAQAEEPVGPVPGSLRLHPVERISSRVRLSALWLLGASGVICCDFFGYQPFSLHTVFLYGL